MMKRFFSRRRRRGSAVVETAVMAPLVVSAMLGMVELGYAYMVRQTVTNAAREGARAAVMPGAATADVNAAVDATMGAANLQGYTTATNLADAPADEDEIWVDVSIPFSRASITGGFFGGGSFEISSRTTMRREGSGSSGDGEGVIP